MTLLEGNVALVILGRGGDPRTTACPAMRKQGSWLSLNKETFSYTPHHTHRTSEKSLLLYTSLTTILVVSCLGSVPQTYEQGPQTATAGRFLSYAPMHTEVGENNVGFQILDLTWSVTPKSCKVK